jgi:cysteine-rich repeat protein
MGMCTRCVLCLMCVAFAHAACMDGILETGEQCDDGNAYNLDGCNTACQLENEIKFFCTGSVGNQTKCCVKLTNPFSLDPVCDCEKVEQPPSELGWTITPSCLKRDIDECNINYGDCLEEAICTNFNVVKHPTKPTHTCSCLGDLIGDGKTMCIPDPDFVGFPY